MEEMDKQNVEKGLPNYKHIIGKQFEHHVTGKIVEIESLDVIQNPLVKELFEIIVAATSKGQMMITKLEEEVDYFLGSHRQIN
jgi:hypothetical protein